MNNDARMGATGKKLARAVEKNPVANIHAGFLVVVLLIIFLVSVGLSHMKAINQRFENVINEQNIEIELAYKMQVNARESIILLHAIGAAEHASERDDLIERLNIISSHIDAVMNELSKSQTDAEEGALLDSMRQSVKFSMPSQQQALNLISQGKTREANEILVKEAAPAQQKMLDTLNRFIELQFEQINQRAAEAKQDYSHATNYMATSGAIASLLVLLIAVFVSRRIATLIVNLETKEYEARLLLENIPDMVWFKNCDSRYMWANNEFIKVAGIEGKFYSGMTAGEVWANGATLDSGGEGQQAVAERRTVTEERKRLCADGLEHIYTISRTPIFDARGKCEGILAVARDVTERMMMGEQLKEINQELQYQKQAMDQHAIVSVSNVAGDIIYVNEKFREISGYDGSELIGKTHRIVKSGYHPASFYDEMWKTIEGGNVWQGEICNRNKNGECYWVASTIVPFLDENNLPYQYIAIRTDITRIKEAEKQLQRSHDYLEELVQKRTSELECAKLDLEMDVEARRQAEDRLSKRYEEVKVLNSQLQEAQNHLLQSEKMASIGQLAAGVAHEINNPIGYVYSNLGTLEKYVQDTFTMLDQYEQAEGAIGDDGVRAKLKAARDKLDLAFLKEDLRALMEESKDGITRVKSIVQNLKDFSHVDISDEWHLSDLHNGINSTLNIVNNEIKYKANVIKEYGELPEVECLSSQLNQVFMNLLVNAAHAIEERGTITVRSGRQGDEVWVEVADTGKGIKPEHLSKIFDPFFTTKPVGKGTGLGLSLAYGIVQKHHGRIEVYSEVGKGATFKVCLPIKQDQQV